MKPTLFFFILISAVACDMVVDIDVPFEKKQLVVNCYFNPDSVFAAQVTLNRHILDDQPHWHMGNAKILLYENGVAIDELVHGPDFQYTSKNNIKPTAGKEYKIEVVVHGYDPVSAVSFTPNPAQIAAVDITQPGPEGQKTKIKVTFQDNGKETNYYQVKAYWREPHLDRDFKVEYYDYATSLSLDDPAGDQDVGDWSNGVFLKDLLFNGKQKELHLSTHSWSPSPITIELRTISSDLYDYETTSALQESINGDPLAQPINVYSNIKNGFGIFAGYSSSTYRDGEDLPEPVVVSASTYQVSAGMQVELTLENLPPAEPNDYFSVAMNGPNYYVWSSNATRSSDNTIIFVVPEGAMSGKVAVRMRHVIAVSDFEIEVQ
jgi:hypothetical protein